MRIWQCVGYHNSGKTTFLIDLHKKLKNNKIKTAMIKHHGHNDNKTNVLEESTDTGKLWKTEPGALTFITPQQTVQLSQEPFALEEWVMFYQILNRYDVLLIEGYKNAGYMKVLFHRSEEDDELLASVENIQYVITIDSVDRVKKLTTIPVFSRDQSYHVIEEILSEVGGTNRG